MARFQYCLLNINGPIIISKISNKRLMENNIFSTFVDPSGKSHPAKLLCAIAFLIINENKVDRQMIANNKNDIFIGVGCKS